MGHINRNIKFVNGPDSGHGFTTYIYGHIDENNKTRIGNAQISGVHFVTGGQVETLKSPLVFYNSIGGNYTSSVTATSFTNCMANCLYIKNSHNITFENNVLYRSYVFGAQVTMAKSLSFQDNLIIGITAKPSFSEGQELTACLYVEDEVTNTSLTTIKNNYCMGSSQHGFAVPFARCGEFEINHITDNTASSCFIGFIINTNGQQCQAFSKAKAFACTIGQICGSPGISRI